jgi:hypothetical protein
LRDDDHRCDSADHAIQTANSRPRETALIALVQEAAGEIERLLKKSRNTAAPKRTLSPWQTEPKRISKRGPEMAVIIGDYELQDGERIVYNRNGHLLINAEGTVFQTYIDDGVEDFTGQFRYVTRVDLAEWRRYWGRNAPEELDILDVAYWHRPPDLSDEIHQPADKDWRAGVATWQHQEGCGIDVIAEIVPLLAALSVENSSIPIAKKFISHGFKSSGTDDDVTYHLSFEELDALTTAFRMRDNGCQTLLGLTREAVREIERLREIINGLLLMHGSLPKKARIIWLKEVYAARQAVNPQEPTP